MRRGTLPLMMMALVVIQQAVELYKLMRQPFSEYNTPPDAQTYTNMMRAALLADEPVVAFKYYNVMVHEGFPPKEVHFYMLFQYLFQAKNYEYCAAVFRTMQNYQRHFVPSLEVRRCPVGGCLALVPCLPLRLH